MCRVFPGYVKAGFVSTVTLFITETVARGPIIANFKGWIHFLEKKIR